jgi:hypothetical protein
MSTEQVSPTQEKPPKDYGDLSILNCTKVVRLFLLDPANGRTEDFIRANENATRADIFVDRTRLALEGAKPGSELMAMSIGLSKVVPHPEAHRQHKGSIVVLSRVAGDQVEWQCDVPFRVLRITKVTEHVHDFHADGKPPDYPFTKSLNELVQREPFAPIRSGVITGGHGHWKQLYKATFELTIDGRKMILDPDVYCEGHP